MKVAICDDNQHFVQMLERLTINFLKKKDISYAIYQYSSGEELLAEICGDIDVVFLDIQMAAINGIETAQILRRKSNRFILIFVTSFVEYATIGYEVKAFRYVLKEELVQKFEDIMHLVLEELNYFEREVKIDFIYGQETLLTKNIMYVESKLHTLFFYFYDTKEFRHLYDTLDNMQMKLPDDEFLRIHKSFLININHLINVKSNTAFLVNGIELPVSQNKYNEVKRRFYLLKGKP